jgi:hypothetical protein
MKYKKSEKRNMVKKGIPKYINVHANVLSDMSDISDDECDEEYYSEILEDLKTITVLKRGFHGYITNTGVKTILKGFDEIDPVTGTVIKDEELVMIPERNGFMLVQESFLK